MMRACAAFFALFCAACPSPLFAQAEHDKALSLADAAKSEGLKPRDAQIFTEVSNRMVERMDGAWRYGLVLSADVRYERNFGSGLRAVFSDRLDVALTETPGENTVNSLREAYVTQALGQSSLVDLGRINRRYGAAIGYNPTDFFKTNAVRSVVSIDPYVLRENRLGTVMAAGQTVWSSGSLTAVYAPKLANQPRNESFNPDLGSTNARHRGLLVFTQRLAPQFAPQWLLYQEEGQSPRYGLNLTHVVGSSTVVFLEWSGGRRQTIFDQAFSTGGERSFRQQAAVGATYTAPFGPSITLEYDYNGAGLTRSEWDGLRTRPGGPFTQYVLFVAALQDPPTRHNLFTYLRWPNMVPQLHLAAFVRHSSSDNSRLYWVEGRYHRGQNELALQWQHAYGEGNTQYGVLPQQSLWNLIWRHYF
jgi:hypothetical protein